MLEPLAASAINTLLNTARPVASSRLSALTMVAVSTTFPPDFFTPIPRRLKGKEKALPDFGGQPLERSVRVQRSTPFVRDKPPARSPVACKSSDPESSRSRMRRSHSHRSRTPPALHAWVLSSDLPQRRHASSHSLASRPTPQTLEPLDVRRPPTSALKDPVLDTVQSCLVFLRRVVKEDTETFDRELVWQAYERVRADKGLTAETGSLYSRLLIRLTTSLAQGTTSSQTTYKLWATRIKPLLHDLEPLLQTPHFHTGDIPPAVLSECLKVRVHALSGDLRVATALWDDLWSHRPIRSGRALSTRACLLDTLRIHGFCMTYYFSASSLLEFVCQRWDHLKLYLSYEPFSSDAWYEEGYVHSSLTRSRNTLRSAFTALLSSIPDLPDAYATQVELWSVEQRLQMGQYLIEVLGQFDPRVDDMSAVLRNMYDQDLSPSLWHRIFVARKLARVGRAQASTELFLSIIKEHTTSEPTVVISCGLYVFACQGDLERTQRFFKQLQEKNALTEGDVTTMIYCHATVGDAQGARDVFDTYCQAASLQHQTFLPNVYHWGAVLYAYVKAGDTAGSEAWLQNMMESGFPPNDHVYSMVVSSLIGHDKASELPSFLAEMRRAGYPPGRVVYTQLMQYASEQQDLEAVDAIYKGAVGEGVSPDQGMVTTLMDAHVEHGSWRGAITAFDYMVQSNMKLDIGVWSVLLKAYVLVGAPFRVVSTLFQRLGEVGIDADERAFALMIQSACDSGRMRTAVGMLNELDRASKDWPAYVHVNLYMLTIIMAGYLRLKDRNRAKAVYDDIKRRQFKADDVTYGIILSAYANERSLESTRIAEDFLTELMEEDTKAKGFLPREGGRARALEVVYRPLMTAWAKLVQPAEAERVYQEMMAQGGVPTLGTLAVLLDAYRRQHNPRAILQLWPEIVALGEKSMVGLTPMLNEMGFPQVTSARRHSDILAVPFSIFVDAMSSGGLHAEIATAWNELQGKGFTLDSHNWNHIAVALVRAGEPERACEIVENVILARREDTLIPPVRDSVPDSPLVSDLPYGSANVPHLPFDESPHRIVRRRAARAGLLGRKVKPWMTTFVKGDFVHPLLILHTISPGWNIWRPHNATMEVLSLALQHLQGGGEIQPVSTRSDYYMDKFRARATSEDEVEARRTKAQETLTRIYSQYPHTAAAVVEWERWQRRVGRSSKL